MEQEIEWVRGVKFYYSRREMFEQKFAFLVVVFCAHAAISLWFSLFFSVVLGNFFSEVFF